MRVHFVASHNMSCGVVPPDVYSRGVGGSELSLISLAEALSDRGHDVTVYNNPRLPGIYTGVQYAPGDPSEARLIADCTVAFRSTAALPPKTKSTVVLWLHDRGFPRDLYPDMWRPVDAIVFGSHDHMAFHVERDALPPEKAHVIDLGVRLQDYNSNYVRCPMKCIFCSVPHRGVKLLASLWPRIRGRVQGARLVVTSDYSLWGLAPGVREYRDMFASDSTVTFVGKLPRRQLVQEQLTSAVQVYPCTFVENFCIAVAECQVAGAVPVTSALGALASTNEGGRVISGNTHSSKWQDKYVNAVATALLEPSESDREEMVSAARRRFCWNRIAEEWEHLMEELKT